MTHYAKKVATCYYNSPKTIVRKNHVKVITKEVELYSLEPKNESRRYARKPLFSRV